VRIVDRQLGARKRYKKKKANECVKDLRSRPSCFRAVLQLFSFLVVVVLFNGYTFAGSFPSCLLMLLSLSLQQLPPTARRVSSYYNYFFFLETRARVCMCVYMCVKRFLIVLFSRTRSVLFHSLSSDILCMGGILV
jgi:hypothetical protein